jgi:hypothetical protein
MDWFKTALAVDSTWAAILLTVVPLVTIGVVLILLTRFVRDTGTKAIALFRNFFVLDVGLLGAVWMFLMRFGPVAALALSLAMVRQADQSLTVKWPRFFLYLVVFFSVTFLFSLAKAAVEQRKVRGDGIGRHFRSERKQAVAALMVKLNSALTAEDRHAEARELTRDLLDAALLHVRDYRGNHEEVKVFANLVLIDGDELVTVARTSHLSDDKKPSVKRELLRRRKLAGTVAGRAISAGSVVACGNLLTEYPEQPKQEYVSILAIPLFTTAGKALGAITFDSPRPYFFQSFVPLATERQLDEDLQPYVQTLLLVLEALIGRDRGTILACFLSGSATT